MLNTNFHGGDNTRGMMYSRAYIKGVGTMETWNIHLGSCTIWR